MTYITVENGELVTKDGDLITPELVPLISAVRAHALENYSIGEAWDHVVECWEDEDIAEQIQACTTPDEAITRMREQLSPIAEREAEAEQYREDPESDLYDCSIWRDEDHVAAGKVQ